VNATFSQAAERTASSIAEPVRPASERFTASCEPFGVCGDEIEGGEVTLEKRGHGIGVLIDEVGAAQDDGRG